MRDIWDLVCLTDSSPAEGHAVGVAASWLQASRRGLFMSYNRVYFLKWGKRQFWCFHGKQVGNLNVGGKTKRPVTGLACLLYSLKSSVTSKVKKVTTYEKKQYDLYKSRFKLMLKDSCVCYEKVFEGMCYRTTAICTGTKIKTGTNVKKNTD